MSHFAPPAWIAVLVFIAATVATPLQSRAIAADSSVHDDELHGLVEKAMDARNRHRELRQLQLAHGLDRIAQIRWELSLTREDDHVLRARMLQAHCSREDRYEDLLRFAVQGLDSNSQEYRERAMNWCSAHADRIPRDLHGKALVLARTLFGSTNGKKAFRELGRLGSAADLSLVRRAAARRFGNHAPDHPDRNTLTNINSANGDKHGYADFVLLRIRFGDVQARREVMEAIEQEDDPQRRIWGIFVAANTDDGSFLASIAPTLDDKRIGAEQLDEWIDPEAGDRRLFALVHTRVCDVAVFAIHALAQPDDKWPMRMLWRPKLSSWHVAGHGYVFEVFDYRAPVGGTGLNEETLRVNRKWIVGYTDEQLQFVKDFVRK